MLQAGQKKPLTSYLVNMDIRPVIFFDSGIGCLPYADFFHKRNPYEKLLCIADRANFPYGTKSKEFLKETLLSLFKKLINLYNPKIIAIACNSASVSALTDLREAFVQLHIIGTVPAIKPAVLESKKHCVAVLGTQRTISDPYIAELAAKYDPDTKIISIAAQELVEFAEYHWMEADKEKKLSAIKPWVNKAIEKGADALVLACTHFLLLKEEFHEAAADKMMIFDSVEGISRRVEFILDEHKAHLRSNLMEEQKILFKINGDSFKKKLIDQSWLKLASHFGALPEMI